MSRVTEWLKKMFGANKRGFDGAYLISLTVSIVLALLLGAGIMALSGYNPVDGYAAMLKGAFGSSRAWGDTAAKSVTLMLTGLAMAIAAQAGMFNVGGEGQLFFGAMASAIVGAKLTGLPAIIGIALAIIAAAAAGGLFAYIPAVMRTQLNISEVITTILLNSAAIYFCGYLANGPLKTTAHGIAAGTDAVDPIYRFTKLVPLSNLTQSVFIAAAIALFVWFLMKKTTRGYEMTLTGNNERFAKYIGINTKRSAVTSMVISGAICGIVGMFEVYGLHGRFITSVSNEFYFDGMLVAMIMRYNPIGIILMSFFFGAMKMGAAGMEVYVGIPQEIAIMMQSIIIFFMAAENGITAEIKTKAALNRAARELKKNRQATDMEVD